MDFGMPRTSKMDEFSEKFQTAFDPQCTQVARLNKGTPV